MDTVSSTFFKMEQRIRDKLLSAGATSVDKAVTMEEADLDMEEQNWMDYVAGGLFSAVKMTRNRRYYTAI